MIDLVIFLTLLALGYGFGRLAEVRHYRSIIEREEIMNQIPAVVVRFPPYSMANCEQKLVTGSVVISIDYFKRVASGLRGLIGGRLKAYETLLDRARREAILRMKEEAELEGASAVFNVRLETSSIAKGKKNKIGSVEVLAYGTAMIPPATEDVKPGVPAASAA